MKSVCNTPHCLKNHEIRERQTHTAADFRNRKKILGSD